MLSEVSVAFCYLNYLNGVGECRWGKIGSISTENSLRRGKDHCSTAGLQFNKTKKETWLLFVPMW